MDFLIYFIFTVDSLGMTFWGEIYKMECYFIATYMLGPRL